VFDVDVAFRQWLSSDPTITALVPPAQIVAGDLPQGANPGAGEAWITFRVRGGAGHSEIVDLVQPSFVITFWTQKDALFSARRIYRAFRDIGYSVLNAVVDEAVILCAEEEVMGQDLSDPATEWSLCVTYWTFTIRAT
jgi:hypothetical protein